MATPKKFDGTAWKQQRDEAQCRLKACRHLVTALIRGHLTQREQDERFSELSEHLLSLGFTLIEMNAIVEEAAGANEQLLEKYEQLQQEVSQLKKAA